MSTNDDREPRAEESATGTAEAGSVAAAPRLPVRASIYIDVDGTVHFGALFEGLVPVAESLGNRRANGDTSAEHADGAGADASESGGVGANPERE